jgi:hypothetical protein
MSRLAMIASACLLALAGTVGAASPNAADVPAGSADALVWPAATSLQRPWTRWWWLGSAVDNETIDRLLETYHEAGLGGVEITCIYGVQGQENHNLPYLSPEWVKAVEHAAQTAKRLDMQVDLPPGSGWRLGGPSVSDADADAGVVIDREQLEAGLTFRRLYGKEQPLALAAASDSGQLVELAQEINAAGWLRWQVPEGNWTLYTVTQKWAGDHVKRAGPGGEGKAINPFSRRATEHYLTHFAASVAGVERSAPPGVLGAPSGRPQPPNADVLLKDVRASFLDSFEYDGDWCDDFFHQFRERRGYRLQEHLPELAGQGDSDAVARVKCDYRETLSELELEGLVEPWAAWSHQQGMLARNQAHGSPGNWLDLYAACDIPETESYGPLEDGDWHRLLFQFASSSAHVTGRRLVSSETATWLDEHFRVTLGQIKEVVDQQTLAGINHVVYHGTAYSPADAAWPGWLFYASTDLVPQNPIWRDLPALNQYVTRCQAVLQTTSPDNDLLVYWPIYDTWQNPDGLRVDLRVHNVRHWFDEMPFGKIARRLEELGYTFDYISDRQLIRCKVDDGRIRTAGAEYAAVLVPGARLMPTTTLRRLVNLAKDGGTVLFVDSLPTGRPGLVGGLPDEAWDALIGELQFESSGQTGRTRVGNGQVLLGNDLKAILKIAGVRREPWRKVDWLAFHRRRWQGGHVYFVKNEADEPVDEWIAPAGKWASAVLMDPLAGHIGLADIRPASAGRELRLQLKAGQAMFIKTFRDKVDGPAWVYHKPAGVAVPIGGPWSVQFMTGGPVLPPPLATQRLASWTELAGAEGRRFAGTARYETAFTPGVDAERYLLDLGKVADNARVELNGKLVTTLFVPPYTVVLDGVQAGENRLAVEVTNVAANRVRDLDQRGVKWRIFNDINFVNIDYQPFDASKWSVRDAGLLGPVMLQPLTQEP